MEDPFSKTKVKSARGLTPKVDFWSGYRPGHIYLQTHMYLHIRGHAQGYRPGHVYLQTHMHLHIHEHAQSTNTQKGWQAGQKEGGRAEGRRRELDP